MVEVIAQRFVSLRKHLSEREGTRLTMELLAEKAGIPSYKMEGLEHGKGTWSSHLALLLFFRAQGYNLDWILFEDNTNVPMMLTSVNSMLLISEKIKELSNRYEQDYLELSSMMKGIGVGGMAEESTDEPEGIFEHRFNL